MKNIIIEEINRIKFLSGYDSSKTSKENFTIISEQSARGLLKTLVGDAELAREFRLELQSVEKQLFRVGGITTKDGKSLKSVDEVIKALKDGKLADAERMKVKWTVYNNTKNDKLIAAIAEDIVDTKTFKNKYSSGTPGDRFLKLKQNNPNLKDEQLKAVFDANERRLKDLDTFKDEGAFRDVESGKSGESGQSTGRRKYSETEVEREIKSYTEVKSDMRSKPTKVLDWLGRRGIWDPVKRVIKSKALIKLALLTGIGVGVWYLFFKKHGNGTVECEQEGFEFSVEANDCVRKGSSDDDDDQTQITDEEGNVYTDCNVEYRIGCKTPKGSEDLISKAQSCLGVKVTGLFNKETEIALSKKINQVSFTKDDIKYICRSGLGSTLIRV
jgi:hypothetical protein